MKKEIINVTATFGIIALTVFSGIFFYHKKDLLLLKAEEYENLAYEKSIEYENIISERNRKELEEIAARELREKEIQKQLEAKEKIRLNQIQEQTAQANLIQKQQEITTVQTQSVPEKAVVKKPSRKSRAS